MTEVRITVAEGVAEVVLDRPAKRNALTGAMYDAITEVLTGADDGDEIRAVLLAGEGRSFCGGNDLQDFLSRPPSAESPQVRFLNALGALRTPLVAAVQGPVVGVGATLLLHCDYVVAASDLALHFPFTSLALVPEAGSSLLLPRLLGHQRAAEVLFSGEPVVAERALDWGMINRVVPDGTERTVAREFALRVASLPPEAVRLTKGLLRTEGDDLATRMKVEGDLFFERVRSAEFVAIAEAFVAGSAR